MPFSSMGNVTEKDWTEIYTQLFKPAIEGSRLRYTCTRSQIRNGAFTKDIVQNLFTANVVLADITFFNPNVMWELGVRHALTNRTILVARKDVMTERIISDLSTYGVIPYDPTNLTKTTQFKRDIKDVLKKIDEDPDRADNPVFDFLKQEEIIQRRFEHKKNIRNLVGLINELIENYRISEGIISGEIPVKPATMTQSRYITTAIDMLLATNYISFKITTLKSLARITANAKTSNSKMHLAMIILNDGKDVSKQQIKSINTNAKENYDDITKIMTDVNQHLIELKNNHQDDLEPFVWMWDQAHQKLLN